MTQRHKLPLKLWALCLAAALIFASLGWWAGNRALLPPERPVSAGLKVIEIGEIAPYLQLTSLKSGELQPIINPKQIRLINYWASWCGPCREEMPALDAYAAQQKNVEVVGIALDSVTDAQAFLRQVPVSFTVLQEPASPRDSSVQLGNARSVLPFTVLIDHDGRLLNRHYGAFDNPQAIADWVRSSAP